MKAKGLLFILTAPSGGGKTTLLRALVNSKPDLKIAPSYTTRPPRPQEVNGEDYHFITHQTFEKLQEENVFLESALVHGHWYGTSKKVIAETLKSGQDMLLQIDWQGAHQIKKLYPYESIGIFILPPSFQELEERLIKRGTETLATVQDRLNNARTEIQHARHFDYVIINNDINHALNDMLHIMHAAHLSGEQQWERHADQFTMKSTI